MSVRLLAAASVLLAALALAAAPKSRIVGKGGYNPHAEGAAEGNETVSFQIDVTEGSANGWLVIAGDVHEDSGTGDHEHLRVPGPSAKFTGTYAKIERFNVVKIRAKDIYIQGLGKVDEEPAFLTVTIVEGKGKVKDYVEIQAGPRAKPETIE